MEKSFEEKMSLLEEIVRQLQSGDMHLRESLDLFEKGAGLVSECKKELDAAEKQVTMLVKGIDGPEEKLFECEDNKE